MPGTRPGMTTVGLVSVETVLTSFAMLPRKKTAAPFDAAAFFCSSRSIRGERRTDVRLLGRGAVAAGDGGAGDVGLAQRLAHRSRRGRAVDLTARRDQVGDV